jgi:hypothetical protein
MGAPGAKALVKLAVVKAEELESGPVKRGFSWEAAEFQHRLAPGLAIGKVKVPLNPGSVKAYAAFVQGAVVAAAGDETAEEVGADAGSAAGNFR